MSHLKTLSSIIVLSISFSANATEFRSIAQFKNPAIESLRNYVQELNQEKESFGNYCNPYIVGKVQGEVSDGLPEVLINEALTQIAKYEVPLIIDDIGDRSAMELAVLNAVRDILLDQTRGPKADVRKIQELTRRVEKLFQVNEINLNRFSFDDWYSHSNPGAIAVFDRENLEIFIFGFSFCP